MFESHFAVDPSVIGLGVLILLAIGIPVYALLKSGHLHFRLPKASTLINCAGIVAATVAVAYLAMAAAPEFPALDGVPPEEVVVSERFGDEYWSVLQDVSAVDEYGDLAGRVRSAGHQQPAADLPHWIFEPPRREGNVFEVVVGSGAFATPEEARADAMQTGARLATDYLYQRVAEGPEHQRGWRVPPELVSQHAVSNTYTSTVEHDFGHFTAPMHRVFVQLRFSPETYRTFRQQYRDAAVVERLWFLGGFLGLITLALGIVASYFRIDALTGGAYRLRLKFAATSLILAAGVLTAYWLPNGDEAVPLPAVGDPSPSVGDPLPTVIQQQQSAYETED